jgi:hypothetical protein
MIGEVDFVKVGDVIGRDDLRTWFWILKNKGLLRKKN